MSQTPSDHHAGMAAPAEMTACPIMPTYGPPTVMFVRGEGARLWDNTDKEYVDFLSGIAVTSLGHANPGVADAIANQARKLLHVSNLYANENAWQVAATLSTLIGQPGQVFFANSGAEANEAALKLARRWGGRGRHIVVSAMRSFHGRTMATLAATGQPEKHETFAPMPEGYRHVPWDDVAELEKGLDDTVAAVFLEPVQGEGGVNVPDASYFKAVREICTERGILLMFDEVQTGLGRTGEWFGFQHFGIEPDVVTMAKALGNGMPIGACWARSEVAACFKPGDHATTFGGGALATAAAMAVLDQMQAMNAPAVAAERGQRLRSMLEALPGIASVRGLGMLLAAEMTPEAMNGRTSGQIASACMDAGVVLYATGATGLRMAPPFVLTDDEMDRGVAAIGSVLAAGAAEGGA